MEKLNAAGGVLFKDQEGVLSVLLIYRRGVWDLPKGKLDPGETVIAEAGTMMYMTDGIRFETRMGDGSESGAVLADLCTPAGVNAFSAGQQAAAAELLGDEAEQYERVPDILDVWFDSGVTHAAILESRDELQVPADLYLEGSDQHRGWFQSSLVSAIALRGEAPYRGVLTHGFTVDGEGRKMSKSMGNVIAPQTVMKTLGADIIRLWVAAADYRGEMAVSDEILKRMTDSYRRMRNTARFLLGNLHDFDPASDALDPGELLALDRWAVDRALRAQEEIVAAYEAFNFHRVYQCAHNFCAVDMGGFYLDVLKDRLYTTPAAGTPRRSAQTAMWHVLEALVRWLAPIVSFTADEIWEHMPGGRAGGVSAQHAPPVADGRLHRLYHDEGVA